MDADVQSIGRKSINTGRGDKSARAGPGILEEPEVKITIPNLQEEQAYFRKEKIMQKPKAMYLDYCQKYASLHLKKSQIIIEDYKFKMEDVMNETFSYDVI